VRVPLSPVVATAGDSIYVVDDQRQADTVPRALEAADRAATALLLIEVVADVVALVRRATTNSGVEPDLQEQASTV
jgi:hypothetical protein